MVWEERDCGLVLKRGEGKAVWFLGNLTVVKATADQRGVGGGVNRRECRSYECASANNRRSLPGSPTKEMLPAGIPSAPSPVGTDTSGRPSQLP